MIDLDTQGNASCYPGRSRPGLIEEMMITTDDYAAMAYPGRSRPGLIEAKTVLGIAAQIMATIRGVRAPASLKQAARVRGLKQTGTK